MATLITKRGDTFRRTFSYRTAAGAVIPLAGATARFAARSKDTGEIGFCAPDFGEITGGTITIDDDLGKIEVLIPHTIMETVASGTYSADLEVTFASGDVQSTETFLIKVIDDVTWD